MDSDELLDAILGCLKDRYENGVNDAAPISVKSFYARSMSDYQLSEELKSKEGFDFLDFDLALKYLVGKTDYVKYIEFTAGYQITFTGKKFIEEGGFDWKRRRDRISTNLKILATGMMAVGSLGLCVMEMIKYWKWVSSINFFSMAYVLLSGVLLGIAIVTILKEVLRRR